VTLSFLGRLLRFGPGLALVFGALGALGVRHSAAAGAPDAQATQQIYQRDCSFCHGVAGEGTKDGPELKDVGAALIDYELNTGRMPLPRQGAPVVRRPPKYDADTIGALVAYVDAFGPGGVGIPRLDVATADLAAGGEDFRLACAACHQAAGQGGALRFGEAPSLMRSTALQVAEATRTGPGTMPVFGSQAFDDARVAGIARYVQYLHHPTDAGGEPLWHFGPLAEGMIAFVAAVALAAALLVIGERR
jgi:ubiquinol-cytochrome c reductase cytochrome c subunit